MPTKNERLTLTCRALGAGLEGVCDHDGLAVFVPLALPGERVEAQITKAEKRYAFARLMRVLEPSPERREPPCPVYRTCGGCAGQHMTYEATLAAKRAQVDGCLRRIAGLALPEGFVPPVLGAEQPYRYRNKTALPAGGTADAPALGFYRRRSHDLVPVADCAVAMGPARELIAAATGWMRACRVPPYDERTGAGVVRHIILRANRAGDAMAMVVGATPPARQAELVAALRSGVPGLRSVYWCLNRRRDNVILGDSAELLWGEAALTETLMGLTFEVGPLSFFQVNPAQTERLYERALDLCAPEPNSLCLDVYCGAGTITLALARRCGRAVGVEIVPPAVEAARRNAERNGVTNAEFHLGAAEVLLPRLVADGLRPDVCVLDPPRKGVELPALEAIAAAAPRRVVYVSCHPPTQARDIALLCQRGYRPVACQPVDMFCYADGVENIVRLDRA